MRKSLKKMLDSFSNQNYEGLTFLNENGEIFHRWTCGDKESTQVVWKVDLLAKEKENIKMNGMEFVNVGVAIVV